MTTTHEPPWKSKRTDETRLVEENLGRHFGQVDAYRYNSASIRVRVIDSRFEAITREKRDAMIEPCIDQLPMETRRDIVTLFSFAPSELTRAPATFREWLLNVEFEEPSPSLL